MATSRAENIFFLHGRLVKDPTDVLADFPHGGTELGTIRGAVFRPRFRYRTIRAEEFGGVTTDAVLTEEGGLLLLTFREYDADAIATLFPNVVDGAGVAQKGMAGRAFGPSSVRAGTLASARSSKLLISPDAVDTHPFLVLHHAIPLVEDTAEIRLSLSEEFGVPGVFLAAPNVNGWMHHLAQRSDLNLEGV